MCLSSAHTYTYIYTYIAKVARAALGKKRWIFKGVFAVVRGRKNRIIVLMTLLKFGTLGLQVVTNKARLLDVCVGTSIFDKVPRTFTWLAY